MLAQDGLYLVFGGELLNLKENKFNKARDIHIVGIYHSYDEALKHWRSEAQATVDNALQRYFVVPLNSYLEKLL